MSTAQERSTASSDRVCAQRAAQGARLAMAVVVREGTARPSAVVSAAMGCRRRRGDR